MYRRPSLRTCSPAPLPWLAALSLASSLAAGDGAAQGAAPGWIRFGAELRGRAEAFTGLDYKQGTHDFYYLHRLRLSALVSPARWLHFAIQFQDTRAPGRRAPVPASAANPTDLHEVYAEFSEPQTSRWRLRAGRQGLSFGAERLVGLSDWSNSSRLFDAVRVTFGRSRARLDWFAATLVRQDPHRMDRFRADAQFHGLYGTWGRPGAGVVIEPYVLWKKTAGPAGFEQAWTAGGRLLGPLPHAFDYETEMAFQAGKSAGFPLRSWAGAWIVGRRLANGPRSPRLFVELDHASGDRDPSDRVRGTFDQLYPTNHSKYGIADRIGWRNMRAGRLGLVIEPGPRWSISFDYYSFWLASRQDFLYGADGAPLLRNPRASSSHVHQEFDAQVRVPLTESFDFSFGYARVFPGRFLRETSPASPVNFAFLMWRLRL